MNPPVTSVVMSVYNGQAFLAEAVESILNQTFRDFEFIIIDDGSTDRTAEILTEHERKDGRIRIHRQENNGRAASLNIGIELAQGQYIARMDADDIALPSRLKAQLEFMERHPDVCVLGGAVELIDQQGDVLRTVHPPQEDAEIQSRLLEDNPMWHPTVMMRKEVASGADGYRKALLDADDYDLWLRISERSKLANLKAVVLRYRIHSSQASVGNMRHQMLCVFAARTAAIARRRGGADPLSGIHEITPELVHALGVTPLQIRQSLLGACAYWTDLLSPSDPEAALRVIEGFLQSPEAAPLDRPALADVWLKAARLHYKQGRPSKAISSLGHALLTRPVVAGRHVKRALTRLAAALKG